MTDLLVEDPLGVQVRRLRTAVSTRPTTAPQQAALCLLEAVEALLTVEPATREVSRAELDLIDGQLRAAFTSVRSYLWQTGTRRVDRPSDRGDDACNP